MGGSVILYILGGILSTAQALSLVWVWYLKKDLTKAQATKEQSEATQNTATAFATMTDTVSKMASDYSATLTKMIELVNSREAKIDELEVAKRQNSGDLEDIRSQLSEMTVATAQRDTELGLLRDSIITMKTANSNQAQEITELKAEVLTIQRENLKKDGLIAEREREILSLKKDANARDVRHEKELAERDERVKLLEGKVLRLEAEIDSLKLASPSPDEKTKESVNEEKSNG